MGKICIEAFSLIQVLFATSSIGVDVMLMIDYDCLDVIDIKVVSKMFDIDEYDVD